MSNMSETKDEKGPSYLTKLHKEHEANKGFSVFANMRRYYMTWMLGFTPPEEHPKERAEPAAEKKAAKEEPKPEEAKDGKDKKEEKKVK